MLRDGQAGIPNLSRVLNGKGGNTSLVVWGRVPQINVSSSYLCIQDPSHTQNIKSEMQYHIYSNKRPGALTFSKRGAFI